MLFKKIAFGDDMTEFKVKLKENILSSSRRITEQNRIECVKQMSTFLQETYEPLDRMLS